MKKIIALVLVLVLALVVFSSCAKKEAKEETAKMSFTIINKTGEAVTEVKITDPLSDSYNVFPAEENEVIDNEGIVIMYFDIPATEDGNHRLTLSYKTESGREETFETLSIEEVNIELLAADAITGATPIAFKMPEAEQAGMYTFYNLTGEVVTSLSLTDNEDGARIQTSFPDGFDPGETYTVHYIIPADRENVTLTLEFVTESGKTGVFGTLHIEEVPISLLDVDSVSGATPISFTAPE